MSPQEHTCIVQTGRGDVSATLPKCHLPANYPSFLQKYTSYRWRLGYIMIFAFVLVQVIQNSMSFAIVCMTRGPHMRNSTETGDNLNVSIVVTAHQDEPEHETLHHAEFDYDSDTQGLLISSVFFAAFLSSILGSFASRRFGPKPVVLGGMLLGGVMMLLFPLAARTHIYLAILARILMGFGVNIVCPVTLEFWYKWSPTDEKAQLVAYSFTGFNIANILVFAISGYVCLIPLDNGWPFIFYIFGCVAVLWCVVVFLTVYEVPEKHPNISCEEMMYIQLHRTSSTESGESLAIPWKAMMRTKGLWTYLLLMFLHNWNASILFSYLPTYMETVLNFNLDENGLLSSLPYITRVISAFVIGYISVRLLRYFSVTNTRKLVQCTGFYIAAGLAVALCFVKPGQEYIAVAIFAISTPFQTVTVNALAVIPLDMAPPFAGFITAFGQALSLVGNLIAPNFVSLLAPDRTQEQWNNVFYMCAGIYAFGATMFLLFVTAEVQPWAVKSVEKTIIAEETVEKGEINMGYVPESTATSHM